MFHQHCKIDSFLEELKNRSEIRFDLTRTDKFKQQWDVFINKKKSVNLTLVQESIIMLAKNPRDQKLASHKLTRVKRLPVYASKIDSDYRIIWEYGKQYTILLNQIGPHDIVY